MALRRSTELRRCSQCGRALQSLDHAPNAKFCSPACRQKAYRRRKAEEGGQEEAIVSALGAMGTGEGNPGAARRARLAISRLLRTDALNAPSGARRHLQEAMRECERAEKGRAYPWR